MIRRIVVFPLPDAPSRTIISPSLTSKCHIIKHGGITEFLAEVHQPCGEVCVGRTSHHLLDRACFSFALRVFAGEIFSRKAAKTQRKKKIYSASSQSRAKNKMLNMANEKSASTIAMALAASTWPSLNFAKI